MKITFFGVRGSTPCSGPSVERYGGNTSCVLVETPGESPVVFDLGTGARYLGHELCNRADWPQSVESGLDEGDRPASPVTVDITALVTHLHWDHIQGLPFFEPMLRPETRLNIVGPPQKGLTLEQAVNQFVAPPLFPVPLDILPGSVQFTEMAEGTLSLGLQTITAFAVAHVGATNGYRIDSNSGSVAYVSDHQQPDVDPLVVDPTVVKACTGVDTLIHDAQFGVSDFACKSDWGHCTVEHAVEVARQSEVDQLVLYHHDPTHDDDWVDRALERAQSLAGSAFAVVAASEGLTLEPGRE